VSEADDDALALWLRDDDPDEQRAGVGRTPAWRSAAFGVVAVLYLVTAAQGALIVVGDLLGWASDSFWNWAGSTTPSGREELRDDVLGLTVRGACLAGAGVVLGLWWRRRQMLAVSGAAVVVALVVGMTTYALAAEDQPDRPSWEDRPRVCQEHSGDGNDCPGG
jgi:hypothetical protein